MQPNDPEPQNDETPHDDGAAYFGLKPAPYLTQDYRKARRQLALFSGILCSAWEFIDRLAMEAAVGLSPASRGCRRN